MGTTEVLGFSVGLGIILVLFVIWVGSFALNSGYSLARVLWITIPLISYAVSLGVLSLSNYLSCNSVNLALVAQASLFTVISTVAFLIIGYLGFFQMFIVPVVPVSYRAQLGELISYAFYIFWAGLYGGAFGIGFTQSCS